MKLVQKMIVTRSRGQKENVADQFYLTILYFSMWNYQLHLPAGESIGSYLFGVTPQAVFTLFLI